MNEMKVDGLYAIALLLALVGGAKICCSKPIKPSFKFCPYCGGKIEG